MVYIWKSVSQLDLRDLSLVKKKIRFSWAAPKVMGRFDASEGRKKSIEFVSLDLPPSWRRCHNVTFHFFTQKWHVLNQPFFRIVVFVTKCPSTNRFYGLLMSFAFLRCFRTCQSTSFFLEQPFSLPETVLALTCASSFGWRWDLRKKKEHWAVRIIKSLACKVETLRFHKIFLFLVQDGPLLVLNGIYGVPINGLLNG